MKVFSTEKFLASNVDDELKQEALKCGWPQRSNGKTKEEFGFGWDDGWAVEVKRRIFCTMPEEAKRYYEDITFIPFVDNDGYESVSKILKRSRLTEDEALEYEIECTPKESTATIKGSKLEYHLLPPEQLAGMARIMNHGEATHETGYMELDPLLYWNATMRHLMAMRSGETLDEEGNSHALAIACNGMILDRQLKAGKELRFEK